MSSILSDVFYFYKNNYSKLLAYIIPVSLLVSVISLLIANSFPITDDLQRIKVLVAVNFIFNPLYLAGLIYLLSALSNNKSISITQCLGLAMTQWFVVFSVSFLYGLLTGIGLFLFVVPGIWIFMRLILSPFLVVLNKVSPADAISESFSLTKNEFWNISGTTILIFSLIILIQQGIISALPDTTVVTILISVLGDIFWSVLTILWFRYYDLLKNNN